MKMTREEAINEAGMDAVKAVEKENVAQTCRLTEGTDYAGYVEFSASVDFIDGNNDERQLVMYVLVDEDEFDAVEELDQIDWDAAIEKAEFKIF